MKTLKCCPKNANCQLWHMLCDGNPCLVDTEIESESDSIFGSRSNRILGMSRFQPGEIVDLAVKIEKTASQFYKKLAKKTPNEQIKSLLLYLAAEEKRHQIKFTKLGKNLALVDSSETYPGEYFEYVRSTVKTHMFNDADKIEQLVENARSEQDIIKLATDFKKDTILVFNGFRNLVAEDKQAVIDDLITEEQIHLVKLTRLRKDVLVQDGKLIVKPKRYLKTV